MWVIGCGFPFPSLFSFLLICFVFFLLFRLACWLMCYANHLLYCNTKAEVGKKKRKCGKVKESVFFLFFFLFLLPSSVAKKNFFDSEREKIKRKYKIKLYVIVFFFLNLEDPLSLSLSLLLLLFSMCVKVFFVIDFTFPLSHIHASPLSFSTPFTCLFLFFFIPFILSLHYFCNSCFKCRNVVCSSLHKHGISHSFNLSFFFLFSRRVVQSSLSTYLFISLFLFFFLFVVSLPALYYFSCGW
ncbi:hypothetical protein TbgDal_III5160 [Trypanosoma brucei gambiense DAL972]|uniref:Uncharacterized protein n=1 Tax=Trypanosoma brucei gambiense (strain MHOM/CI/86/DAL972) TaxID=679716 RepID=C9ZLG5_TRYB9|nr:hypothetical protein TbgDal_III5160 [Trypanosoma brucei gambiense DAL972]CBH10174.1 hypothetical protein TbgDal_III5160 [Trypanosoma brucei gambiense DAL972]|eukprot:XP_011772464.1 hypothetical protein TbgDal_III5160 [Trypanosoma brucei gambiense DAL972]